MKDNNPWKTEHEKSTKKFENVREMKFKDNHTHKIRVLPNKDENKLPYSGYIVHWIPQKATVYGRPIYHNTDKRCCVCETVSEMWNEIHRMKEEENKTDKSPEVIALLAKVSPISGKKTFDMNVLDREDMMAENPAGEMAIMPKRMSAKKSISEPIFEYAAKDGWGNPSDAEEGYDFEIVTKGEQRRREYSVIPDREAKALTKEELEAVKYGYDLVRKTTAFDEIKEILKGAKPPYDGILKRLEEEGASPEPETEKEVEHVAAEVEHEAVAQAPVEAPAEAETTATEDTEANASENENDLNAYECKGENEPADDGCKDCPVSEDCKAFQPIYKKAKELGIDRAPKRTTDEIKKDVEAKAQKVAPPAPATGGLRPKKKLPF